MDHAAKRVTLYVAVAEGQRQVLQDLSIAGTYDTSTKTVSDLVNLKFGSPVTPALVSDVQKRLYDAGVFGRGAGGFHARSWRVAGHLDSRRPDDREGHGARGAPLRVSVPDSRLAAPYKRCPLESEVQAGRVGGFPRPELPRASPRARRRGACRRPAAERPHDGDHAAYLRHVDPVVSFLERKTRRASPSTGSSSSTTRRASRRSSGGEELRLELSWGLAYHYRRLSLNRSRTDHPAAVGGRRYHRAPANRGLWDSRDDPFDSKRGRFHSFGFDSSGWDRSGPICGTHRFLPNFLFVPKGPSLFASGLRDGSLDSWDRPARFRARPAVQGRRIAQRTAATAWKQRVLLGRARGGGAPRAASRCSS